MGFGDFLQDNSLLHRKIDLNPETVCQFMIQSDIYFRARLCPINRHNYYVAIANTKFQKQKNTKS